MSFNAWLARKSPTFGVVLLALASLVGVATGADAQPLVATITYPANGAVSADLAQPIQWTSVANVQAYYLYVGTTPGAKDLVNTGEIQRTSYLAANLPAGPTLYARLWTKAGGAWQYVDSTFTAAAAAVVLTATITYPADAAVNVDLSHPIQWSTVANAQAYYLYVGTTPGAKDLVNTGETLQTSRLASTLPTGQILYARMWTKVAGSWRYQDSTFTAAPQLTATLTYPVDGQSGADLSQAIRWTSVPNVQAYYLYVGSSLGAKDLVNTGETLQTSYQASGLPAGQTLYVRMWTRAGNVWRYIDSTFTASAPVTLTATLTTPSNGAVNANMAQPFQWTSVAGAQSYYLYVGTTIGAKDVVDTGEIQPTSYLAANVPSGQTLYARLWTRAGGVWRYVDSTFTAAPSVPLTATLTYPLNSASNADLSQPMQWTSVSQAQVYYLYVGTTLGAKDLVDSQETSQTSYLVVPQLPSNQTLYVRLWTKVAGVWRYVDSTFTAGSFAAVLTNPTNGAVAVDPLQPATWTSVTNVQAYYLYVGSAQGAKDFVDSGETLQTSTSIAYAPAGATLYARLWTKVAGVWRYRDSTFTASTVGPVFVYPTDDAVSVDVAQPFQWTAPANTQANRLKVGSTPGGSDLFDSGVTAATSIPVPGLPTTGVLYAEAASEVNGLWRLTDVAFTPDSSSAISTMLDPADGDTSFDAARPFMWVAVPLARGYRLTIGTTPGASDLHDSGEIEITRRFVPGLPAGVLFGRLQTRIDGQWYSSDFTFSASSSDMSSALQIKSALWATDQVRNLTVDSDDHAFSWTRLAGNVFPRLQAVCSDYADELLEVLADMNIQLPAKRLVVAFNPQTTDNHTLVEMFDPVTSRWMLLDPTFDLTITRTSDGSEATAEDLSAATVSQTWSAVSFRLLGALGDQYARGYYLDYPLLFVNVYHDGLAQVRGTGHLPRQSTPKTSVLRTAVCLA